MFEHEILDDGHALRGAWFCPESGTRRLYLVPKGFAGPQDIGGYSPTTQWPAPTREQAARWLAQRERWVREGAPSKWAADLRLRPATDDELRAAGVLAGHLPLPALEDGCGWFSLSAEAFITPEASGLCPETHQAVYAAPMGAPSPAADVR